MMSCNRSFNFLFAGLLLAATLCVTGTSSFGNVILLDDAYEDGTFLGTSESPNLPDETVFWYGNPEETVEGMAGVARINVSDGGSSSRKGWWNFAPANQYSPLGDGDTLTARINLIPQLAMSISDSRNLRTGLFYDPSDPVVEAHTNSDGGGSGNPFQDSVGYGVQIGQNSTANTSSPLDAGKRTLQGGASTSLLGSSGAYTKTTGGDSIQWIVGNEYQIEQIVNRVSDSLTTYTVNIHDIEGGHGGGLLSTITVNDNGTDLSAGGQVNPDEGVDRFSFIGWRTSNSESTAFRYDITHVYVEGPALVPEPATLTLLGLCGLALVGFRRR